MIEITKDQCTRMLVWDNDEANASVSLIACKVNGSDYPYKSYTGAIYKHAKPLPEPKTKDIKMSALDVMWWMNKVESEGKCIVIQNSGSVSIGVFFTNHSINNKIDDMSGYKFNELIHKDGKTTLLYDEWKEFTFENCDMVEG